MKIAIIGAGVAGLTAGYKLHNHHELTLFEKSHRIGGNAYSITTKDGHNLDIAVAAFGQAGYPKFYKLLEELGIPTDRRTDSYMSFYDLDRKDQIYSGSRLTGAFARKLDFLKPSKLAAFIQIHLGLKKAEKMYLEGKLKNVTLGQLVDETLKFDPEKRIILLTTLCLLSSMSPEDLLKAPAAFFTEKLLVHNDILSPKSIYSVKCARDGTQSYINALAAPIRDRIRTHAEIRSIVRDPSSVQVLLKDGTTQVFDKVIFACQTDEILKLLPAPTPLESELLGAWRYHDGKVVVHRDHSSFPPRDLIQSYTFLYRQKADGQFETSVNGALWDEPHVSPDVDYISSQHPNFKIRPDLIEYQTVLRTPIYDFKSYPMIKKMPLLNGQNNSYFCGSYFGFGLHEDAVSSALAVAALLT